MPRLQVKRGLKANLPTSGMVAGEPHVTTDRGTLHVATGASTSLPIVPPVDDLATIPSVDGANDLLLIHDASENAAQKEKKITFDAFKTALNVGGGIDAIFIDASEFIPRTTNGCGIDSQETSTNRINRDLLAFDAAAIEFAQKWFSWPNGWTTARVTFYWKANTGTGSVVWGAQLRIFADTNGEDQAFGTAQTVTDAVASANTIRKTSATSGITPGGTAVTGDVTCLQIYRDATNGSDDMSIDAFLQGVLLEKAS